MDGEEEEKREKRNTSESKLDVKNKRFPNNSNVLLLLGNLLQPQTEGFPQVNLDMSFTNVNVWDINRVMDWSYVITYCYLHNLKKAEYLARSMLATFLNIKRSENAKSMELFTTTVTKQSQEFQDKTSKKTGIMLFGSKKSKEG